MVMERAAAVRIEHVPDPRHPAMFRRIQQILGERRGDIPAFHDQLAEVGREALVGACLERLHGGDDGERSLHQVRGGVFEDEGEVPGQDARLGVPVVGADVVGGEVAEVLDEDLFGEGEQAEECGELFVFVGLGDVVVAAVEPVDEELEGGVVVFGEVELFGLGFGEVTLECRFEVVGAVA